MEWPLESWGWSGTTTTTTTTASMIEQAREELEILEAQHPDRFGYLKLDLKSLISALESQNRLLLENNNGSKTDCSSVSTQGSFILLHLSPSFPEQLHRTVALDDSGEEHKRKLLKVGSDRIDVVIQKAQDCLHKIHRLKTSFV